MLGVGLAGVVALIVAAGQAATGSDRLDAFFQTDAEIVNCSQDDVLPGQQGLLAIADGGWFGVGLGKGRAQVGLAAQRRTTTSSSRSSPRSWAWSAAWWCWRCSRVLAYTGLRIARRVTDPFRRLVAAGGDRSGWSARR